ncbi:hypothetical protein CDAR_91921 [Caerostris darwini]|uniref:Uncharacterized protein n=1 Tax=Caerostris darwini TaxID=1538125 RepID=A0AAV4QQM1_9ARAC|nr:hypothetical protein CDAR_91921 [Caerostris darwini]
MPTEATKKRGKKMGGPVRFPSIRCSSASPSFFCREPPTRPARAGCHFRLSVCLTPLLTASSPFSVAAPSSSPSSSSTLAKWEALIRLAWRGLIPREKVNEPGLPLPFSPKDRGSDERHSDRQRYPFMRGIRCLWTIRSAVGQEVKFVGQSSRLLTYLVRALRQRHVFTTWKSTFVWKQGAIWADDKSLKSFWSRDEVLIFLSQTNSQNPIRTMWKKKSIARGEERGVEVSGRLEEEACGDMREVTFDPRGTSGPNISPFPRHALLTDGSCSSASIFIPRIFPAFSPTSQLNRRSSLNCIGF